MIYIGADHRGYQLKEDLKKYLESLNHQYEDIGPFSYDLNDDFVDFAIGVASKVGLEPNEHQGILICRNGAGMDFAANKLINIRATVGFNVEQVRLARNDDNINIISLPSDFITIEQAKAIVEIFLKTKFEGHERQLRRLEKIKLLEKQWQK